MCFGFKRKYSQETIIMSTTQPDIMRIKDLAEYLHISKSTVRRYLNSGIIPYSKVGGIVYIKREDVLSLVESNKICVDISENKVEKDEKSCYNVNIKSYMSM